MGEVFRLAERERRHRTSCGEGPAQILIFTGVRIERGEFRLSDRLVVGGEQETGTGE